MPRYTLYPVDVGSRGPQGYRFRRDTNQGMRGSNPEITMWCLEQFGPPGKRLRWRYLDYWHEIHFRDECDAFAFRMRWN